MKIKNKEKTKIIKKHIERAGNARNAGNAGNYTNSDINADFQNANAPQIKVMVRLYAHICV